MAHRGLKALSAESAVELANRSATGKALATVVLGLPSPEQGEDDDSPNVALGYLVYVRQGGFLVVLPVTEEIRNCLDAHGLQVGSAPAYKSGELDIETPRGRILGRESVDLVDLSLGLHRALCRCRSSSCFQRSSHPAVQGRGRDGQTIQEGLPASLANEWISSVMPQDIAQEYLTGEEFHGRCGRRRRAAGGCPSGCFQHRIRMSAALRARVKELEDLIKGKMAPPPVQACGATAKPAGKAPPLIPNPQTGQLGPADWVRLQRLAGPPLRAGAAETRRPAPTAAHQAADDMMHMLEQEAEAVAPAEEAINAVVGQGGDPIQQLLFAPASSEPSALGETHCTKACRSAGQHAGRLGQRKRQWRRIRSQRMHCSGHLRPNDAGCEQVGRSLRAERSQGARFSSRTSGQFIDAEVCGEETSCFRKQTDDIPGIPDGRRMGFGTWQQQPRVDGCRWESLDVSGTGVIRPRTSSISLAFDGSSRPPFQHPAVEQEEDRTFSIQQTGSGAVDCGESGICQGHRHAGKQDLGDEEGHEAKCRRRRGCRAEAKKTTKEPKSKVEVKGCRGEHFDQLGVGDGYETASAMSGSLDSFEAVSWAGTARASPCINPGDLPSSGPCDKPYPAADMSFRDPSSLPDFHNSNEVFNPIELAEMMCKQFWKCRTSLTAFAHRSIHPSCTVENYPLR